MPQRKKGKVSNIFVISVEDWWTLHAARARGICSFSWKEFRKALQSKFYPRFFFNANRNEFMSLVQGYTNVAEYQKKFTELAKYALGFVIDETENVSIFKLV